MGGPEATPTPSQALRTQLALLGRECSPPQPAPQPPPRTHTHTRTQRPLPAQRRLQGGSAPASDVGRGGGGVLEAEQEQRSRRHLPGVHPAFPLQDPGDCAGRDRRVRARWGGALPGDLESWAASSALQPCARLGVPGEGQRAPQLLGSQAGKEARRGRLVCVGGWRAPAAPRTRVIAAQGTRLGRRGKGRDQSAPGARKITSSAK